MQLRRAHSNDGARQDGNPHEHEHRDEPGDRRAGAAGDTALGLIEVGSQWLTA